MPTAADRQHALRIAEHRLYRAARMGNWALAIALQREVVVLAAGLRAGKEERAHAMNGNH